MINMEEQKKIAIEMWQYIKSQIAQHVPLYSITSVKIDWLKHNYPSINWDNSCLLCNIYMHPCKTDSVFRRFECPDCPLTKKYKGRASYGCALSEDTPWDKVVSYDVDEKAAVEACDEIIEVIKSL